jgi:hypothetical protein
VTSKDFFFWSGSFAAPPTAAVKANKVADICRLKKDPYLTIINSVSSTEVSTI